MAVQSGEDLLEVSSWGQYFLNGVEGGDLSAFSASFNVTHKQVGTLRHIFEVSFGGLEKLILKTNKDIVSFSLENAGSSDFEDSVGMMGAFGSGGELLIALYIDCIVYWYPQLKFLLRVFCDSHAGP